MSGKVVRIGGASAFWGDSEVAGPQLVRRGKVDYLVYDYLAEVTMSILSRAKAKDADLGYATDFVQVAMRAILRDVVGQGIKVVTNAGGINPMGCAAALGDLAREMGLSVRIGVVEGDDVMELLPQLRAEGVREMYSGAPMPPKILSANAYLGGFPIATALEAGAQIVITGRCVDSATTLGVLIHEFGWNADEFDKLAQGSLLGHVIECGAQATGGLHTDWETVPNWADIGYPIAEAHADGSFVIGKPPGTGGIVTVPVIAEQMLYEVGDPAAYMLPDVVCDFTHVRMEQVGPDRVKVWGCKGMPPTSTYKVSSTWFDGFKSIGTLMVVGRDAVRKAERSAEAILERTRALFREHNYGDYTETHVEALGGEALYGANARARATREAMMRLAVTHPRKEALEIFGREIAPAGTSWSPGTTGSLGGGRPKASPNVKLFSFLVNKERLNIRVTVNGETQICTVPIDGGYDDGTKVPASPAAGAIPDGPTVVLPLIALAFGRSGDKGDTANIGIIARNPDFVPLIRREVTPERVHDYFRHFVKGTVTRHEVPGVGAFNFVLTEALGGGGMASLRSDPLAKAMAQQLLDLEIAVPAVWAETYRLAA